MTRSPERVRRFSAGERWIHLALGVLMGVCIVTAALLYVDPLSALVGRRHLVAAIHFGAGVLLPVPLVVGYLASAAFRADARRLNRFLPADGAWLRDLGRGGQPSGKFNAGQKLNSAFVLGSVVVMVVTGLMLHYFDVFPDSIRTGATFVHDLVGSAVVVVALGHVWMAWKDPEARRGLRTGSVDPEWAQREHPLWREAQGAREEAQPRAEGDADDLVEGR